MKKVKAFLFFYLCYWLPVYAQFTNTDIAITVQTLPPYSANIHEYANFLNQSVVSLQNNTNSVRNLRFQFVITNLNTGVYFRSKKDFSVIPFVLQPLEFRTVTGVEQKEYVSLDIQDYETNASEDEKTNLLLSGILPEGNYQYCVQAFKYDDITVELSQAEVGCAIVPISNIQPPIVLQPMCNGIIQKTDPQQLVINWMPATGNITGAAIKYDLYMVGVPENISPYDAMNTAVQSGAGTFVFHQTDISENQFIYGSGFLPLEEGTYAIQVKAYDPMGILQFANQGLSPVCSFEYKNDVVTLPVVVDAINVSCASCNAEIPMDPVNFSKLDVGDNLKFGNQSIKISTLNITDNKASGTGILTFMDLPIRMEFSDVTVNSSNVVMAGQASAVKRAGVSFTPTMVSPDLGPMTLTHDQFVYVDQFASDNAAHLKSNMMAAMAASGFDLPFGVDQNVLGVKTVIAVVDLRLSPTAGAFDAATVVDITDGATKISLGARNICIKPNGICGDGVLFLGADVNLPSLNLKLIGGGTTTDPATHVRFKDSGFEKLKLKAEYTFSTQILSSKKMPGEKVIATLFGEGKNWSDWKASVMIDPFIIKGIEDLTFSMADSAYYDHSSLSNPAGIPAALVSDVTWTGFYLPLLNVALPNAIHKVNSTDPIHFSCTGFIIDGEGVSGNLNAENILGIGDGSLDGWYYSVDKIYGSIIKNSFSEAGMKGKMVLPVSPNTAQNQLDYTSTLSSSSTGKLGFQFVIQPKNNIDVPLWYSKFELYNTSNITVEYEGDEFRASTDLSGKMDIVADIESIHVTYKLMEFEHLKLMSYDPYYSIGSFVGGFASPQKDISGFDVTLDKFKLVSQGGLVGPSFEMGLNLADLGALPKASVAFSILGKPELMAGRPSWHFEKLDLKKIMVDGDLGPAKIKGELEFYENDPVFQDGIRGELTMTVIGALSVKSQGLFGHKDNYTYFYIDANVKLETGIPITTLPAPPVSVFGMGAGLYYHLEPAKLSNNPLDLLHKPTGLANNYTPNANTAGFLGNIVLGLSDGSTLQGICGLNATVNVGGGKFSLQNIRFDGSFYMMCPLGELDKSVGKGAGVINFDVAHTIFDLQCAYEMEAKFGSLKLQSVSASLALHVDGGSGDWYLKMGEPNAPIKIHPFAVFPPPYLAFNSAITGMGYFMTGSAIDPSIVLNDDVVRVCHITSIPDAMRNTHDLRMGEAIVFGAGLALPKVDENFLCFYIKFNSGIGFDFSLDKLTTECAGVVGAPGFNGYYANGSFHAFLEYDFGLDVDVWFYKGRVSAGSLSVGTALLAGMPNPTWFEGWVNGHFSVLGGVVEGNMNFHLEIGKENKCIAEKRPFGDGLPIISQIAPGTLNSTEVKPDVEVDKIIEVAFNYPVEQQFTISDKNDMGNPIDRTFKIEIDYFNVIDLTTNAVVLSKFDNRMITWDDDHKSMMLYPKKCYTPQGNHEIEIKVKVLEWNKNTSRFEQTTFKGAEVSEIGKTYFKAGGCPKSLAGKVLNSYPFVGQRYFLQEENSRKGHLDLPVDYDCLNDDKYELKVQFISYKNQEQIGTQEVNAVANGLVVEFPIPVLPNEAVVHFILLKKLKSGPYDNMTMVNFDFNRFGNVDMLKAADAGLGSSKVYMVKTAVEGNKRTPTNITLYDYYFRTSKYNNLSEKVNAISSKSTNTTMYYPGTDVQTMEITFGSGEGFDIFDLQGRTYPLGKANFCSPPIVDIREADSFEGWRGNFIKGYFQDYFVLANSRETLHLGLGWGSEDFCDLANYDFNHYYGDNISNCFLNPVGISDKTPTEPALTFEEAIAELPPPNYDADIVGVLMTK